MDSDDMIDAENGQKLASLARRSVDPSVVGYVMQVHCPGVRDGQQLDVTAVDHVKMFRNSPAICFEFRIHEQVLPSIRRAGGTVAWTDIYVTHSGSDQSPEGRRAKQDRDLRLLELEAAERPDHPFVLFNLGMTWADVGDHRRAAEFLQKSIHVSSPDESHVRKAYALLIASVSLLGELEDAERLCLQGLSHFPNDPELLFRKGLIAQHLGRYAEAVDAYQTVLSHHGERYFSSVDRGITGYKARHNLGLALTSLGQHDRAEKHWRRVIDDAPNFVEGRQALADSLLEQQKFTSLEVLADQLRAIGHEAESRALQAELAQQRGDTNAAIFAAQEIVSSNDHTPTRGWTLNRVAKILFELRQWQAAEGALRTLVELEPQNTAARRNLLSARAAQYGVQCSSLE